MRDGAPVRARFRPERLGPGLVVPAVLAIGLVVSLGAWTIANAAHPFDQPGETWRQDGLLTGFDLHLMPGGRYADRSWCDVCPFTVRYGRWTEQDGIVALRLDDPPHRTLRLRRERVQDCDVLRPLPDTDGRVVFRGVLFRDPDRCAMVLWEHERGRGSPG